MDEAPPRVDRPAVDGGAVDSGVDGGRDDAGRPDGGDGGCLTDRQCDDGLPCTVDRCDVASGACLLFPDDAFCEDGRFCTDDRCVIDAGCVRSARVCPADAFECSDEVCDERDRRCLSRPDDLRCPLSHACDLQLGCQARAFAHDETTLYDVRLPSGQVLAIGRTGERLFDIALSPDNALYGVSAGLYTVNPRTGAASDAGVGRGSGNGADFSPSGQLYLGSGSQVLRVDVVTGATTSVAVFPPGRFCSGDLAFVGSRLLGTATGRTDTDELVEFDLPTGTSRALGLTGFPCVWGLAAFGMTLYGLTCDGRVLSIDTSTGAGREISRSNIEFYGATAR